MSLTSEGPLQGSTDLMRMNGPAGESIEVSEVSSTLFRMWVEARGLGKERLVRACQGNLVLWGLRSDHSTIDRVIEEMTRVRPVRVLLLEEAAAGTPVGARISALCHLSRSHRRICCEKIALTLPSGSEELAVGAVRSLLRGDVPVTLWCLKEPRFDLAALGELCGDVDLLLVDSSTFGHPAAGLKRLLDLALGTRGLHPLDWTWQRIAGWRRAIAERFEPLSVRERIPTLHRIGVEGLAAGGPGIPAPTLLLAGWIVSSLGRPDLDVEFRAAGESGSGSPGTMRVEFLFTSDPSLVVSSKIVGNAQEDFAAQLAEFLGSRSGDPVYERALGAAACLKSSSSSQEPPGV